MSCPVAAPSAQRFHWPWLLHAHITDEWMNGGKKICVQIIHYTKNNEIGQRGFLDYCSSCVILNG